jgi:hypothetical protein
MRRTIATVLMAMFLSVPVLDAQVLKDKHGLPQVREHSQVERAIPQGRVPSVRAEHPRGRGPEIRERGPVVRGQIGVQIPRGQGPARVSIGVQNRFRVQRNTFVVRGGHNCFFFGGYYYYSYGLYPYWFYEDDVYIVYDYDCDCYYAVNYYHPGWRIAIVAVF